MIWGLVLGPLLAGAALYLLPRRAEGPATWIAAAVAFASFLSALGLRDAPDQSVRWFQRPFTANFHVGLGSGISFWLVLLVTLVTGCALLVTRVPRQRDFVAQMLFLLAAMTGVFVARDVLLFALFFDLMLIPVFLVLVMWGPPTSSAWRYLIYNLSGGLGLLLATAAYGVINGSTDVIGTSVGAGATAIGNIYGPWIFAGFALAFLIKTPVWPLHTWMPDTYADLPPPVVAAVSAVQSKAGLYGFIVIGLALFPTYMHAAAPVMFVLGLISLLYGGLVALTQDDLKRIVAYSSLSHLGLIILAIFSFNSVALAGAVVYIIAHGLFSAALFLILGWIESREETRSLARLGGLGARNPRLAGALVIAALAALGLPGLCGFAGELLILTGVYKAGYVWPAAIALIPIVLAAAYMLRLYQGTMNGPEVPDLPQRPDLTWLEGLALTPLVIAIVWLGVDAGPLARIEPQLTHVVGLDAGCLPRNSAAAAVGVRVTAAPGLSADQTADVLSACYAIAGTGELATFDSVRADYLRDSTLLVPMKEHHADTSIQH
ncbi:MAG TPA: NADH-quinone oxidoreductase subunit M [Candidatus Acidoferrales bacterium]|nr:NADH-quinone oxidoreductase subunit M [Candidatus Acidoferrales bacterium]